MCRCDFHCEFWNSLEFCLKAKLNFTAFLRVITRPMSILGKWSLFFSKENFQKLYSFAKYIIYSHFFCTDRKKFTAFHILTCLLSEINYLLKRHELWSLEAWGSVLYYGTVFSLGKLSSFPHIPNYNVIQDLKLFSLAKCWVENECQVLLTSH